jgi:hypothetical protein
VSRSTYSEQFGLAVTMGGLSLLVIAIRADDDAVKSRLGLVSGLVLGGATLFRIDSVREAALVLPISAWLFVRHHAAGRPLMRGLSVGLLIGITVWLTLTPNYIAINGNSVILALALLLLCMVAALGVVVAATRGATVSAQLAKWVALTMAAGVAAGLMLLASRPLWWVSRGRNEGAALGQRREGLPIDPTRLYYENSIEWTAWWVGWPTMALALVAAVYLTHRAGLLALEPSRSMEAWAAPFVVLLGSAILVWARPGINPDHPWADRRLVLLVPFVVALAVWMLVHLAGRINGYAGRWLVLVTGLGLVAGPVAISTGDHATDRIGAGTYNAITTACDYFEPTDVVLTMDVTASFYWPQTIRGICRVPVLAIEPGLLRSQDGERRAEEIRVAVGDKLKGTPYSLVLMSTDESAIERGPTHGDGLHLFADVVTTMNDSTVTVRPDDPQPVRWQLWAVREPRDN